MQIHVRFESNHGTYVPVLSGSTLVTGKLVSQNAGSSNPCDSLQCIYYQVGGGGVNGYFAAALGPEADPVNTALRAQYDAKFGAGTWSRDSQNANAANPPLTSFLVSVDPAKCAKADDQIVGMIYSVGPKLPTGVITDEGQYRGIYTDALAAVVNFNANAGQEPIAAVRITMLSTGLYASGGPTVLKALFDTSARLILEGIEEAAASAAEAHFPQTVLVNNKNVAGANKELDAFTNAAKARGLPVDGAGFDLPVQTLP